MALYARACPSGEINQSAINQALHDLEVPSHKRRLMRRIIPVIHREVKKTQSHRPSQT
ncbi:MAG: hypothetical protein PHZ02_07285 [Desulfocapsaceae bacterium]|nr:hypothetical protein [Desulfocapsaceae bacterium]